jgi:FixJ family two-component response regulator
LHHHAGSPRNGAGVFAKILVVDDNAEWLDAVVYFLRQTGYTVRGALTFSEGQRAIEAFSPDLLITDVRLHEHNGLSLFLRSHAQRRNLACIVVSGYDDPVLRRDAFQQGVFEFLIKPVDFEVLLDAVSRAIATRGKRRWPRKNVPAGLVAQVEGQAARVLDVSYGGVRLELPFPASVGSPLEIMIPEIVRPISANAVWVEAPRAGVHECGAALKMEDQTTVAWRTMIDALEPAAM